MKKIISLLSVFAMIATLFTTVAFADANNKFYIEESVDGTNVTLTFYLTTDKTLTSASGALNMADAKAACDSISAAPSNGNIFNYNATQNVLSWTVSDVNGFTGEQEIGVLTLTNVKADFAMAVKRAFTAKDDAKVSVVADFTNEQVGYTVKAPTVTPAGPEVAELEKGGEMYGMNTQVAKVTTNGAEVSKAKVTLGKEFKYYDLPTGVSGTLDSFIAIIRYSAELGDNPAFELSVE